VGNGDKYNKNQFEINEMFMAQAAHYRCFYGIIKRSKDSSGNPHVFSRIIVNDGFIMACVNGQKVLGKMLDEMCIMVLDMRLNEDAGVYIEIFGDKCFLN
jgi:hypothetical protein